MGSTTEFCDLVGQKIEYEDTEIFYEKAINKVMPVLLVAVFWVIILDHNSVSGAIALYVCVMATCVLCITGFCLCTAMFNLWNVRRRISDTYVARGEL
jgi:hypothetical protein